MQLRKNWQINILDILIVLAGISATGTIYISKYVYIICITILCTCEIFHLVKTHALQKTIKNYIFFITLGLYSISLVLGKQILNLYENGITSSLVSDFGNCIYIIGAALLFGFYSKRKTNLFINSYILGFVGSFIMTGQDTLYDVGNVCRTLGAYDNPNHLAMHASAAFFFSLLFCIKRVGPSINLFYSAAAAISLAAIINSGGRAMILGLLVVFLCALFLLGLYMLCGKIHIKRNEVNRNIVIYLWFTVILVATISLYLPKVQNARINLASNATVKKNTNQDSNKNDERSVIKILDRMEDKKLTSAASFTENRRFDIWSGYIKHMNEYILFGSDINKDGLYFTEYGRVYASHNMIFYILFKYGIVGFLLFIMLLTHIFLQFIHKRRKTIELYIYYGCLLSLCIFGMLHESTKFPVFWCVIGLAISNTTIQQYDNIDKPFGKRRDCKNYGVSD